MAEDKTESKDTTEDTTEDAPKTTSTSTRKTSTRKKAEPAKPKYESVAVDLSGLEQNPVALVGRVERYLRLNDVSFDEVLAFKREALEDQDKALDVARTWVTVV